MANYWGYRIDTSQIDYFRTELDHGRLRQGWGWDEKQDLRKLTMNRGARRNLPMFYKVKKGDYLLIPRIRNWGEVTIAQATENWDKAYTFRIDEGKTDYGHIFPAKFLKSFSRQNKYVSGDIRKTLRTPMRFWTLNHYAKDVRKLIEAPESDLKKHIDHRSRMDSVIGTAFKEHFDEDAFGNRLFDLFNDQFTSEEWEFALVEGLSELFPYYQIDRTGGSEEHKHGTDILIKMPSLLSDIAYGIAIQVKDHDGIVNAHGIEQLKLADDYWGERNVKIVDKWLLVTKAKKEDNVHLLENNYSVKVIMAEELKDLLTRISARIIGLGENDL